MPLITEGPKNGKKYTRQEAFERAWRWAVVEKHDKALIGCSCQYRTQDNANACLIGCLLPESFLSKMDGTDLDGAAVETLLRDCDEVVTLLGVRNRGEESEALDFWSGLQVCHDGACFSFGAPYLREIEDRLRTFARRWRLKVPEEETHDA